MKYDELMSECFEGHSEREMEQRLRNINKDYKLSYIAINNMTIIEEISGNIKYWYVFINEECTQVLSERMY